jgi:MFS family permease
MDKQLKKQINYVYLYTFFTGMMFWYGIEQLFMEEIGDGVFVRGVALAVFSITMVLANIPTGAFSDVKGRVKSLKIALLMMALGLLAMSLSQNAVHYSLGALFFGLMWSFDEGAKEAFVYDTLVDNKQEDLYQRVLGKIYAALLIGAAASNFLSGFIADATSLRTTYVISFIPCAAAFYFVTKLVEPDHHKQVGKKILRQLDDAGRALKANRVLLALVTAQMLIYVVASISVEFAQAAIVEYTSSAVILGGVWGLLGLIMAAGNLIAHRVKHIFAFIFILLGLLVMYILTREVWLSLIPLFIFVTGLEIISIKGEGALQKNTSSHLRATISSIPGSVSMLLVAGLALWIGSLGGSVAVPIFAVSFPLMLVVTLVWLRYRDQIPRS